jgi:alpha-ketoglutarate-dependent 2,4-dichlorophenoxyacetate dioxygenase
MWDNRQTMHRARRYKADEVRDMRRTTIAGDGPTAPQVGATRHESALSTAAHA